MPSAEFEPAIPATKRPQTYALDSAANGIGEEESYYTLIRKNKSQVKKADNATEMSIG
jgi:hypothetical protein